MSEKAEDKDSTDGQRNTHVGCEYLESCGKGEEAVESRKHLGSIFQRRTT